MIIPVILCGGSGTRLWPVSRHHFPKQFHALTGDATLFQQTLTRCAGMPDAGEPVILANDDYRFLAAGQMDELGMHRRRILLEPAGRNTAPAIALAALAAAASAPDAVLLVAPSDHAIAAEDLFRESVTTAARAAAAGYLVMLGVTPGYPATGYGYIKRGPAAQAIAGQCFQVDQFVEKPDAETASQFLRAGTYLWNSGMFLFTARSYLAELGKHRPGILAACERAWAEASSRHGFTTIGAAYGESESLSVDYAVMEKTDHAMVVPYSGDWNDIGAWSGLAGSGDTDDNGNRTRGRVRLHDVRDSVVFASERLVAGVGLENAVIVETRDAVLVSTRSRDQDVKHIVEALRAEGAPEADQHARVMQSWGHCEELDRGEGFHVRRLLIKPGASTPMERHRARTEHWVVVRGRATVTRDDEELALEPGESTCIPAGTAGRLSNPGQEDLVIMAVQTDGGPDGGDNL